VNVRIVKDITVFELELVIKSSEKCRHDLLIVKRYEMRDIDKNILKPMNDTMNDKVEILKYYKFKKIVEFKQNPSLKDYGDMTF